MQSLHHSLQKQYQKAVPRPISLYYQPRKPSNKEETQRHALLLVLTNQILSYSFRNCMSYPCFKIVEALPCDIIKNSITTLLVHYPLSNEHTGRRRGQLPTAQQPVPVPHVILKTPLVHLTGSIAATATTTQEQVRVLSPTALVGGWCGSF